MGVQPVPPRAGADLRVVRRSFGRPAGPAALLLVGALLLRLAGSAGAASLSDRISETTLANGLTALLVEEHKAPVVSVQVYYKVGSRNEETGKTGLTHMLEHMFFKGTPGIGPREFDRLVQRNGGQDNAYTTANYTAYYIDFAADRVNLALELEADRMAHLSLDEKEFLPERQVVLEERRLRIDDQPAGVLGEVMRATAFLAHPYRWPVIGWESDIQAYTIQDLRRFHQRYYMPNNAVLIVAGDIRRDAVLAEIQALFGSIPRGPDPPKVVTVEPLQQGERRVAVRKEAELPLFSAAYHTPTITHPDSFPLEVLGYVLAGGESARLPQRLVYEQQLASAASASYSGLSVDPYLFSLSAAPLPGKSMEDLERALFAEIECVQREPISERELAKAKNQIEAEFIFAQDSVHRLAGLLGTYESVASWRLLDGYLEGIRAVTAAEVQRVAAQYLVPDNRTVAILVPTTRGPSAPRGSMKEDVR